MLPMTHGDFGSFPRSDCRRYEVQDGLQARRRVRELSYQAHLSGHYSNHSPAFTGVLDAFPGGIPEQIDRRVLEAPRTGRLGNGVVQRAVIKALVEAGRPMDVGEAQTAVEQLLGYPVSRDSVGSCLSTGARAARLGFERVARGRYRLPRAPPRAAPHSCRRKE